MTMAWIGSEDGAPVRPARYSEWLVRVRVDGRIVETRITAEDEREARRRARRLGDEYTLTRLR